MQQKWEEVNLKKACSTCGASDQTCSHTVELQTADTQPAPLDVTFSLNSADQHGRISKSMHGSDVDITVHNSESVKAFDPLKGRTLIGGRYEIQGLIGTGGMGAVYKVRHQLLDKIYALKVLNIGINADEKVLRRFDQEAKAAGVLRHDNLIAVHDYGASDDGIVYLVMDYLDGVSLDCEIKR